MSRINYLRVVCKRNGFFREEMDDYKGSLENFSRYKKGCRPLQFSTDLNSQESNIHKGSWMLFDPI